MQVEAIGQLIQQGKVRAWGLSNETTLGVTQHCTAADQLGVPRPATVQNCYNLVHRMAEVRCSECWPLHHLQGQQALPQADDHE
jgi:aryl-alcohol dehydrogenase-like predicted oxidoreductase